MSDKIIEVDGLEVTVDGEEFLADADAVIEEVRKARSSQQLEVGESEYQDYAEQGGDVEDEPDDDSDEDEDIDEEAAFDEVE